MHLNCLAFSTVVNVLVMIHVLSLKSGTMVKCIEAQCDEIK